MSPLKALLDAPGLHEVERAALSTVLALATGDAVPRDVAEWRTTTCPLICELYAYRLLAAVLGFDAASVASALEGQRAVSNHPAGELWLSRGEAWLAFMNGDDVSQEARRLGDEASTQRVAAVRIEATVLSALSAQDNQDAIAYGRRATRMARAEGLVHHEYLANIVLARVRRTRSGKPYLAARILAGLAPVVPPAWYRWIDWEVAMSGPVASSNAPPGDDRARQASESVQRIFQAASAGDRASMNASFDALERCARDVAPLRAEALELRAALDPTFPAQASDWASGRISGTWDALGDRGDDHPFAFVFLGADGAARRIVGSGAGLLPPTIERVESSQRKDARVMRAVAALALAGSQGLSSSELFRQVYGFDYESKHESSLRVLLHRSRALLGDRASVDKDSATLRLTPKRALLIADPRCARTLEQRVMMLLGSTPDELTAAQVAEALNVSLRQAQRILKSLSEQGLCASDGNRGASYRIEDTTFLEPTRSRVFSAPGEPE